MIVLSLSSTVPPRVTGTVAPLKPSVTIDVHRPQGTRRRLLRSQRVTVRRGVFAAKHALGSSPRGLYVVVARTAAGGGTPAGASAPVTVEV